MSLKHLSSPFGNIKKIEPIGKQQFPSPATKRQVPDSLSALYSSGNIKENEIIIQSQDLGDKNGVVFVIIESGKAIPISSLIKTSLVPNL